MLRLSLNYSTATNTNFLARCSVSRGASDQAEDIVQEVFIELWDDRVQLGSIENLNAWIFRIAQHKAINSFRKIMRQEQIILDYGKQKIILEVLVLNNCFPPKNQKIFWQKPSINYRNNNGEYIT